MDNAAQARGERDDRSGAGQSGEHFEPRSRQGTYFDRRYDQGGRFGQSFRSNPNASTAQERYEQFDAQRRMDAGIGYPDPRMLQMQRDQGYPGYGNFNPGQGIPPYIGYNTGYAGREHIDIDPVLFERFRRAAGDVGGDAFRWFNENYRIVPRDEIRGRDARGSDGARVQRYSISLKR